MVLVTVSIPYTSAEENPVIVLETNYGKIKVELYPDSAPKTVENFLKYVESGFFDGLIFHRIIADFMIQGGGFNKEMTKKNPSYAPIINEASTAQIRNNRGTIAMARTNDPNSATNQFFINVVDNNFLDWDTSADGYGYCAFGRVTKGMDVVDDIASVKTGNQNGYSDVPNEDVIIEETYVKEMEASPGFRVTPLLIALGIPAVLFYFRRR